MNKAERDMFLGGGSAVSDLCVFTISFDWLRIVVPTKCDVMTRKWDKFKIAFSSCAMNAADNNNNSEVFSGKRNCVLGSSVYSIGSSNE